MPSDAKKNKAAAKKNNRKPTTKSKIINEASNTEENNGLNANTYDDLCDFENDPEFVGSADEDDQAASAMAKELESLNLLSDAVVASRTVTGVLHSHLDARDLHVGQVSITFHGQELLIDAELKLNNKNRYGLIGINGCGKSTLLAVIANREIPVPKHLDIFLLQREMAPCSKTALEAVMDVDEDRKRLEKECEELATKASDTDDIEILDRLEEIHERLESLDAAKAKTRAAQLLFGLGFTKDMQNKQVKHFSGGWRMRIALARALFVRPAILLLDEPTNHLDLSACVWLENELKDYPRCLVIISHSQDFLNGVCNKIINMAFKKLKHYGGNYDTFIRTKAEMDENQMREYNKQQREAGELKEFINRFGHGTKKMARQAQSREKQLNRMMQDNPVEVVQKEKKYTFSFPSPGYIPPPVIQVRQMSFRYHVEKPFIYKNLEIGVDLDTRAALVGPNGAGKSTLLKLIAKELDPTDGLIQRHSHVRMGRFHQHLHEKLNLELSPIQWVQQEFPEIKELDDIRKMLGRYGLTGAQQTSKIKTLSDGQRCRIIFAYIAKISPHILLMDEPTNHLDIQTIDSLASAINDFEGGLLLVSHDFRLISQVAKELWVCDNQTVIKWDGDIFSYKKMLQKKMTADMKALVER